MPKLLKNLPSDIQQMLAGVARGTSVEVSDVQIDELAERLAKKISKVLRARTGPRPAKTLFASELGKPCLRQLWYEHNPDKLSLPKEKTDPKGMVKFIYGDVVEEIVLFLAEAAGHTVTNQQDKMEMQVGDGWVVRGAIDAVVDGHIVDVKSASAYSFKKFEDGYKESDDPFGYVQQLRTYVGMARAVIGALGTASVSNPAFIAVDKVTGDIVVDERLGRDTDIAHQRTITRAQEVIDTIINPTPPEKRMDLVDHVLGKSLGNNCKYCPFKYECWKDSNDGEGLRTFIYSTGPSYLAVVNPDAKPRVPEITDRIKEARNA